MKATLEQVFGYRGDTMHLPVPSVATAVPDSAWCHAAIRHTRMRCSHAMRCRSGSKRMVATRRRTAVPSMFVDCRRFSRNLWHTGLPHRHLNSRPSIAMAWHGRWATSWRRMDCATGSENAHHERRTVRCPFGITSRRRWEVALKAMRQKVPSSAVVPASAPSPYRRQPATAAYAVTAWFGRGGRVCYEVRAG